MMLKDKPETASEKEMEVFRKELLELCQKRGMPAVIVLVDKQNPLKALFGYQGIGIGAALDVLTSSRVAVMQQILASSEPANQAAT